jgi:para-nitrobenzyl esterase
VCRLSCSVVLVFCFGVVFANAQQQSRVQVEQGALLGTPSPLDPEVLSFRAIPYALPPIGNLRWRPPQPPAPWPGVRDATKFGSICSQPPQPVYGLPASAMSEDCLTLNVWTTWNSARDKGRLMPVMVWIHGGGFTGGASGGFYDGTRLAKHGVVMISINYRLGIFGFLGHPELSAESPQHSSGNYALLDQIAALQWVRNNIRSFGGDPERVTIFGESAGGSSIGYLLASPLAKHLFARAIAESPALLFNADVQLRSDPTSGEMTPMESIGLQLAPHIATLRQMPPFELESYAEGKLDAFFAAGGGGHRPFNPLGKQANPAWHDFPWWPIIDGWVLPQPLVVAFSTCTESIARVPLLTGWNSAEGPSFLSRFSLDDEEKYTHFLDLFSPEQEALRGLFPRDAANPSRPATALGGEAFFGYGTRRLASSEPEAFVYYFDRVSEANRKLGLGALHGTEIPYLFGLASALPGDADRVLSEQMLQQWTNFAKTGNPNGPGLPNWKPYDDKHPDVLRIDEVQSMERAPGAASDAIFQRVYARFQRPLDKGNCAPQ